MSRFDRFMTRAGWVVVAAFWVVIAFQIARAWARYPLWSWMVGR